MTIFKAWIGAVGIAATAMTGAHAAESSFWSDLAEREQLTGDWGGARTELEKAGITFEASFTGDFSTNVSGGLRKGDGFTGLLEVGVGLNLEDLVGWKGGEIYAGAYFIRGHGLSTYEVGNLLAVSGIEFDRSNKLGQVYFKQTLLDDRFTFKIGQLAADEDFATSETAGLFVNSTFGWPSPMGANLYSGGPAYPVPTPGVHASFKFNDAWSVQAGLYNGDPAGRDNNNDRNANFPVNDGAFAIGEVSYKLNGDLPGEYKFGAWYSSLRFDDLRRPVRHDDNYALYGVIDQTVWQEGGGGDLKNPTPEPGKSLSIFARAVISPQDDRNLIDSYFDVGFNAKGFVPGRADDIFGVAFAYAHISNEVRKLDRINGTPRHSSEMVIEASYQAKVTGWLNLQPFFQYVIRPGGGDADPSRPNRRLKDAAVFGLRTQVAF